MSLISELTQQLRSEAEWQQSGGDDGLAKMLSGAADVIEELSPKQVADTICELSATKRVLGHYQQLGTLEEVRDAVEKQRAKKPKTKTLCGDIELWCPGCGESHIMMDSKKGFDYCHHCDQKLDWSEKDEQIN